MSSWVFIDPLTARRTNQFPFGEVYSGLTRLSDDIGGDLRPELAESWQVSSDGLEYTFRLRDGLVFSDGAALTVEDVKRSWERALSPEYVTEEALAIFDAIDGAAEMRRGEASTLRGVDVVDDSTLAVRLNRRQSHFPYLLADPIASVLSSDNVSKWGTHNWVQFQNTLIHDTTQSMGFSELPTGTGPYRITHYREPVNAWLEPNPFHWRSVPSVDRISITDPNYAPFGQLREFGRSEVDSSRVDRVRYEIYVDGDGEEAFDPMLFQAAPAVTHLALNTAVPPFDDLGFRRALSRASNRQPLQTTISRKVPLSLAASGLLRADFLGMPGLARDRGFEPDRDDSLQRLAGSKYAERTSQFTLTFFSDGTVPSHFLETFGRYWDRWLGLELGGEPEDSIPQQAFLTGVQDGTLQMRYVHVKPRYPDPCAILCRIPDLFGPNALSEETEVLREMLHDAAATADRAARIAKYQAIEAHILDRALVIPAYWDDGSVYVLVRPYISGYKVPAYGGSRYEDVVVDTTHPDYPADR